MLYVCFCRHVRLCCPQDNTLLSLSPCSFVLSRADNTQTRACACMFMCVLVFLQTMLKPILPLWKPRWSNGPHWIRAHKQMTFHTSNFWASAILSKFGETKKKTLRYYSFEIIAARRSKLSNQQTTWCDDVRNMSVSTDRKNIRSAYCSHQPEMKWCWRQSSFYTSDDNNTAAHKVGKV